MDASVSVDDAALQRPGQTTSTVALAPQQRRSPTTTSLSCLGTIVVSGEPALVVWPDLGDTVAIDFKVDGHRYALVTGLDTALPRLRVQPMIGRQISSDHESAVLAEVVRIWAGLCAAPLWSSPSALGHGSPCGPISTSTG